MVLSELKEIGDMPKFSLDVIAKSLKSKVRDENERAGIREAPNFETMSRTLGERLQTKWIGSVNRVFDMLAKNPRDRDSDDIIAICHFLWRASSFIDFYKLTN